MRVSVAWTVLLLAACAGGEDKLFTPPAPPPPPAPLQTYRFEISPGGRDFVALLLGGSAQLAPRMIGSAGDTLAVSGAVGFISRVPSVLSVNASGLVTALTIGSSTITASTVHGGQALTDTLAISVACTVELRIAIAPVNPVLQVGQRFTPTVSLSTCQGQISLTDIFAWSTLHPAIVSVNPTTGETVALQTGTASVVPTGQTYRAMSSIVVTVQ